MKEAMTVNLQDHIYNRMNEPRNHTRLQQIRRLRKLINAVPTAAPTDRLLRDLGLPHAGDAMALAQNPAGDEVARALRRARDIGIKWAIERGMHPDVLGYIRRQRYDEEVG